LVCHRQGHGFNAHYRATTARAFKKNPSFPLKTSLPEADSFFSYFLSLSKVNTISANKMMNKAKGSVWRKKHKDKGFMPDGLRGLDQQAA
jgi:hypothetical protein